MFTRFEFAYAGCPDEPQEQKSSLKEKYLNFKGGLFGAIGDLVGGVVDAITGGGQTDTMKDIAQSQREAQKQALEEQKRQQQLNEQEQNKLNQNSPQYSEDGFYDSYDTSNIFTGTAGLTADDYTLGKKGLLGVGNSSMSGRR